MPEIGVRSDQHVVPVPFERVQQFAVFECGPTAFVGSGDIVADEVTTEGIGGSLVKKDAQLNGQGAACYIVEDRAHLLTRHSGEPLKEFGNRSSVLEILEQRGDRYPSAAKNPRTADPVRISFDGRTC